MGGGGPPGMMPGGEMPPPSLPKSPAGGPGGPGSSPALSPGGGKGNQEAARSQVKMMLQGMLMMQQSFDMYSDEYGALAEAIRSLRNVFGKSSKEDLTPAAINQMAQQSKQGKPFAQVPAAGMQNNKPPPSPAMAAPMPGGM